MLNYRTAILLGIIPFIGIAGYFAWTNASPSIDPLEMRRNATIREGVKIQADLLMNVLEAAGKVVSMEENCPNIRTPDFNPSAFLKSVSEVSDRTFRLFKSLTPEIDYDPLVSKYRDFLLANSRTVPNSCKQDDLKALLDTVSSFEARILSTSLVLLKLMAMSPAELAEAAKAETQK